MPLLLHDKTFKGTSPSQESEDGIDLIDKVAVAVNMTCFDPNQIDVAHRTSSRPNTPIIIISNKKGDRNNWPAKNEADEQPIKHYFKTKCKRSR